MYECSRIEKCTTIVDRERGTCQVYGTTAAAVVGKVFSIFRHFDG